MQWSDAIKWKFGIFFFVVFIYKYIYVFGIYNIFFRLIPHTDAVAQWQSISLRNWGPRVRSPSAFSNCTNRFWCYFYCWRVCFSRKCKWTFVSLPFILFKRIKRGSNYFKIITITNHEIFPQNFAHSALNIGTMCFHNYNRLLSFSFFENNVSFLWINFDLLSLELVSRRQQILWSLVNVCDDRYIFTPCK